MKHTFLDEIRRRIFAKDELYDITSSHYLGDLEDKVEILTSYNLTENSKKIIRFIESSKELTVDLETEVRAEGKMLMVGSGSYKSVYNENGIEVFNEHLCSSSLVRHFQFENDTFVVWDSYLYRIEDLDTSPKVKKYSGVNENLKIYRPDFVNPILAFLDDSRQYIAINGIVEEYDTICELKPNSLPLICKKKDDESTYLIDTAGRVRKYVEIAASKDDKDLLIVSSDGKNYGCIYFNGLAVVEEKYHREIKWQALRAFAKKTSNGRYVLLACGKEYPEEYLDVPMHFTTFKFGVFDKTLAVVVDVNNKQKYITREGEEIDISKLQTEKVNKV